MILIENPSLSGWIFIAIFFLVVIASAKPKKSGRFLSQAVTRELKGFAILTILFSHIGYFLVDEKQKFIWPLSIMAGVGVNLFLFLSGYGLSVSAMKKPLRLGQFYWRKLSKLYIPLWLSLVVFIAMDYFILQRIYPSDYLVRSFMGIFKSADLSGDINSPLWYFTMVAFYYLLFPLIFNKRFLWVSALAIYGLTYFIVFRDPRYLSDVMRLYQVHIIAFPFGMFIAWITFGNNLYIGYMALKLKNIWSSFKKAFPLKTKRTQKLLKKTLYYFLICLILGLIAYWSIHSEVGGTPNKEQNIGTMVALLLIILYAIKRIKFKTLYWFGIYSYEIYLIHWPLLSRYDLFYRYLPAWLATVMYLLSFLVLGYLLNLTTNKIVKSFKILH